jgi:hypothetical protein
LDTTFQGRFESGSSDAGYILDSFDYEGQAFPQTPCRDVVMSHREKVIDLIFDVGNSINDYCRAVSIMEKSNINPKVSGKIVF